MPDRTREMSTAHARQGLGNRYCRLPQVALFGKVRPDPVGRSNAGRLMPETASATTSLLTRPLVLVAAAAGIVLAGTLALWAHYGTAVFYEMIIAGIAACL
jgi:hypothetical protein